MIYHCVGTEWMGLILHGADITLTMVSEIDRIVAVE